MTVFLTFRLGDSLPASVVRTYEEERRILGRRLAREGDTQELRRDARLLFSERIEAALDASLVLETLRFFDGDRYVLHAASVMPNHAHVVTTLSPEWALSKITHSWKSFTASQAQKRFGHQGSLWQDERYDHIVRDEGEFSHYVRYTLHNPAKAGLRDWPYVREGINPPLD